MSQLVLCPCCREAMAFYQAPQIYWCVNTACANFHIRLQRAQILNPNHPENTPDPDYETDPALPSLETRRREIREKLYPTREGYCAEPIDIDDARFLLDALTEQSERIATWRGWARFMYLGEQQINDVSDDEVRRRVCAAQDAHVEATIATLRAAAQEVVDHGPCSDPDCCPTARANEKATQALKALLNSYQGVL